MHKSAADFHIDFLRVAPLPNIVLAACISSAYSLFIYALEFYLDDRHLEFLFLTTAVISFLMGAFFSLADIIARYREYLRIRKILHKRGFREKVFRAVCASRCQRDAAMWAAQRTGHRKKAREFYLNMGYRWYHLLPDLVMLNPLLIFNPDFLVKAFKPGKKVN